MVPKRIEKNDIDLLGDYLFRSYFDFFKEREFCKAQIKLLDALMEDLSQSQNQTDPKIWDYSGTYKLERYCVAGFQCRKALNASKEELLSYLLPLSHLKEPCWLAVGLYQELGDFKSAEKLLLDFIEQNNSYAGLVQGARMLLQEVYCRMGNREAQQENLRMILIGCGYFEEDLYQRYKEFFSPDEWAQQRDALLACIKSDGYRNSILIQEGLTDRLLQSVVDSQRRCPSISQLRKYISPLSSHVSELLPFFEACLETEMERATSRQTYREIACHLEYLSGLEGGLELARELKMRWMERYKRRSALLDELGQILK